LIAVRRKQTLGKPTEHPLDEGCQAEQQLIGSLFSPEASADPTPLFRSVSLPGCSYAAVRTMLHDARFGPPGGPASEQTMFHMFARWMINLDGDRHVRLRTRFQKLFTPRRAAAFREAIAERAGALLDGVAERGEMDLVSEFARPLPFSIIASVLGVPKDRWQWVEERMVTLSRAFAKQREPGFVQRGNEAVGEMLDYFSALLTERAANPRDDLASILASDTKDDETRLDLLANCVFFVEAGHATTTSLISGGTLLLLEHPDQLERLRMDPALIAPAVEEILRLITPVSAVSCLPREDVESDGFSFSKGIPRFAFLAAANRDADEFPDPDRFDIGREPGRHLAFSAGRHFCLGAPLARLHGQIAIPLLLRRLEKLRVAGQPRWRGAFPLHELENLPVSWNPSGAG
jgi:pimeloyl-[acyl-carrier protein] synthase